MKNETTRGAFVAALAAGLFASMAPALAHAADSDKVHCHGVNACKGHGGCKSASNACAGKNGCKGKGWVEMTAKECAAKGGRAQPEQSKK